MFSRVKSFLFENKNASQTVAKNTIWLSISNFGGRLIKAAIIIYGARALGTAGYGVFSYALTLAGFFTFFVDPGINSILIREGAGANTEERQSFFSAALVIKAIILLAVVFIILLIAPLFSTLPGSISLLPFVALIIVFDSTREVVSSLFRVEEKMQWDAAAFLFANISIVILGFVFLKTSATATSFTKAYALGTAAGALMAIWLARKNLLKIFSKISLRRIVSILNAAWPFAITSALGILFTNTDVLIISWMKNASDVGVYSAAIRILQILYIVPIVIQTSTLPILSRLAKKDQDKFRFVLEKTVSIIFFISIPISFGGAILGKEIMGFVFGPAYAVGGLAFSILMLGVSFDYAAGIMGNSVFAYNHQKTLIISSAIGGLSNVILDLLLIPRFGIAGSAIATIVTQILTNSYLWHAMKKLNRFYILNKMSKIITAGAVMLIITTLFSLLKVNLIINIAISGIIYISIIFILKEPLIREIKDVLNIAKI